MAWPRENEEMQNAECRMQNGERRGNPLSGFRTPCFAKTAPGKLTSDFFILHSSLT
jgi:hypothetical protein